MSEEPPESRPEHRLRAGPRPHPTGDPARPASRPGRKPRFVDRLWSLRTVIAVALARCSSAASVAPRSPLRATTTTMRRSDRGPAGCGRTRQASSRRSAGPAAGASSRHSGRHHGAGPRQLGQPARPGRAEWDQLQPGQSVPSPCAGEAHPVGPELADTDAAAQPLFPAPPAPGRMGGLCASTSPPTCRSRPVATTSRRPSGTTRSSSSRARPARGRPRSCRRSAWCSAAGAGRQMIGHTQPRRIAARSVAERIAEELGTELGETSATRCASPTARRSRAGSR